jgi:hypothetical protein
MNVETANINLRSSCRNAPHVCMSFSISRAAERTSVESDIETKHYAMKTYGGVAI